MGSNMTASEWLDRELEAIGLSQNELARQAGISSSQVSQFRRSACGIQTAVDIAIALGTDPTITLALANKIPRHWLPADGDTEMRILHLYHALDEKTRSDLLEYARFLYYHKSRRERHHSGK